MVSLALGVLSGSLSAHADRFSKRRAVLRASWMQDAPPTVLIRFVLRCGTNSSISSLPLGDRLDTVCAPVTAEKNGRLRGPLLALVWWLEHALTYNPRFVGKADDDVWLHLPDLEAHLLRLPSSEFAYVGRLQYIQLAASVLNRSYTFHHFSTTAVQARRKSPPSLCQALPNVSTCAGPLPFACGPFYAVGRAVVEALLLNTTHRARVDADLATINALPTTHVKVLDDTWMGAALWRFVGGNVPLTLFQLEPPLYSDDASRFDAQRLQSTLVWHNRLKFVNRIRVVHALHTARRARYHCPLRLTWTRLRPHCGGPLSQPGEGTRAAATGHRWPLWIATTTMDKTRAGVCESPAQNRSGFATRADLMKRNVWKAMGLDLGSDISLVEQA